MKASCIKLTVFFLLCAATIQAQSTFYSNSSTTNFNTLSGWSSNTDGTGSNPAALNNSVRLIVQNGHTKNTSAALSLNQLTIQNGGIVAANHSITILGTNARFIIAGGGIYIHRNTANVSNTIFNGEEVFAPNSTFRIENWQSSGTPITPAALTRGVTSSVDGVNYFYGNLEINWPGSGNWNQNWPSFPAATYLTAGNFSILSVGDFRFTQANNAQPDVYVAGNFLMNSTGSGSNTLNFSSGNNCISYLNVNGNITHTDGTITASSISSFGYLWTYGNQTAQWNFSGGVRTRVAYYLDGNKQINLLSNLGLGVGLVGVQLYIAPTVTLNLQQFTLSNVSTGAFITNAGTITTAHPLGLWASGQTNRAISNGNGFHIRLLPGSTTEYNGPSNQVVSSLTANVAPFDRYENIRLTGGVARQLEGNTIVNGVFDFSGAGNYLDVLSNSVTLEAGASVLNNSQTSFFRLQPTSATNGRLRWNGLSAASRVFPVGTGTHYLPVTISPVTGGSDFAVSVFVGTTNNGLPGGVGFDAVSRRRQVNSVWRVDRVSGTANAHLRFDWFNNSPLEGSSFTTLSNAQIGIWRNTGTNWLLIPPPTANANNNTLNFASTTATAISNFGTAGTGLPYIVANVNVLTGVLRSFELQQHQQQQIRLKWEVEEPAAFASFELQRSSDGRNFKAITQKQATAQTQYTHNDVPPAAGRWLYRLRMIDVTGAISYSEVLTAQWNLQANGLKIIGNPVTQELFFTYGIVADAATYRVINLNGTAVIHGMVPSASTHLRVPVGHLPNGVYVLQLQYADGRSETARFIRQ